MQLEKLINERSCIMVLRYHRQLYVLRLESSTNYRTVNRDRSLCHCGHLPLYIFYTIRPHQQEFKPYESWGRCSQFCFNMSCLNNIRKACIFRSKIVTDIEGEVGWDTHTSLHLLHDLTRVPKSLHQTPRYQAVYNRENYHQSCCTFRLS